ncbi:hypothetical protein [Methylobacterium sp. NEAU K]|uniref:hypothetical protein n=1 Tax=Methylobacterium sp. NEAU K TaxID=3064946 RepID=UPI002735285D|nr:hypothetical protein [Methylobacterium sp. NEAU K]MDP4006625.1 hypothetical protein [Methylobacterium sp. NEAU K]
MSNVVSFPKDRGRSAGGRQPIVVTVTDHDGSTLTTISILAPSEVVCLLVPTEPVRRMRAIAALRYALTKLEEPDADPEPDPENGSDWTLLCSRVP